MGTKKRNRCRQLQSDNSDHVRHPRHPLHRSLGLHRQRQDPPAGGGRRRCSCNVVPWPVRRAVLQPLLLDQLLQPGESSLFFYVFCFLLTMLFFFRPGRAIRLVRELGEHEHRLQLARHLWPPWPPTNRIHLNPLRGLSPPPPPQFPNSRRRRRFYFFPPLFVTLFVIDYTLVLLSIKKKS